MRKMPGMAIWMLFTFTLNLNLSFYFLYGTPHIPLLHRSAAILHSMHQYCIKKNTRGWEVVLENVKNDWYHLENRVRRHICLKEKSIGKVTVNDAFT